VEALGHAVLDVLPVALVPVELLDTIGGTAGALGMSAEWMACSGQGASYLEAVGVLVAGPDTVLGGEEKTFLVLLADVVVQVLGDAELTVELEGTTS
jgi:hypothetical protein